MSKFKHAQRDARKAAYAQKTEKNEKKVINWIFGTLIALGILYAIYTVVING